jgi:hypothetical protein
MINIRAKGASGETEVAKALEAIIRESMLALEIPAPAVAIVQRNQNQSAVGGSDLSNTFGLSIEVKRQEQLSVATWWKQCEASAIPNNERPVLLYRQNGKKWRCVMYGEAVLPAGPHSISSSVRVLMEIDWPQFLNWFALWVHARLSAGERPRV